MRLQELTNEGLLIRFEPKLDPGELSERAVYMRQEAWEWCFSSNELGYTCPNPTSWDKVHTTLNDFVTGQRFIQGMEIRRFDPKKDDIWELKALPPDAARIFGWFYDRNIFIATHCVLKKHLCNYRDYKPQIEKVRSIRNDLGLRYADNFQWDRNEKKYSTL